MIVAPDALLRTTVKRSSDSCVPSSVVCTEMVFVVCPAVKVSVSDCAV